MGLSAEQIEQVQAHGAQTDFEIWQDNKKSLQLFLLCCNQWRMHAVSAGLSQSLSFAGFDYVSCATLVQLLGQKFKPKHWRDLQLMEAAARTALNERGV
jgi:Phage related hypothetical protein (DUF1799)